MELGRLDHVNIKTANLDEMIRWYEAALGMRTGQRPDFEFPGAWLYAGDYPIVHLVGVEVQPAAIDPGIEHYAIRATGLAGLVARLTEMGVPHTVDPVPGFPVVQVNVRDPDGNHIHIDFDAAEVAPRPETEATA